jgi:hypothetical protein
MLKRLPILPGLPKANLADVKAGKLSTAERLRFPEETEQPRASSSAQEQQQWGQSWEDNRWEAQQHGLWQQQVWDAEERHQKQWQELEPWQHDGDVNTSSDSANSPHLRK